MSDTAPMAYGRDASGRFTPGNTAGQGRPHAFARQAAALRKAFFEEVTEANMRALVRTLLTEATGGNLQAARLVLLWIVGKPHEPLHPDGIEAMEAVEAETRPATGQVSTIVERPLSLPPDREAREHLAVQMLAQEIRAYRSELLDPSTVVETALEDVDRPC